MTPRSQTSTAADSGVTPDKQQIPSPEELLGETPLIYTSNYDTADCIRFCAEQLAKHKEEIKRGTPVLIMVSEKASTDDIELVCRQFWTAGWKVGFLSCDGRPHRLYFSRPRFRGVQFRNGGFEV